MNYKPSTMADTQAILDKLIEDPTLSNQQLRDIVGMSIDRVRHCMRRLKKHGNIVTEKDRSSYQYKRILTVVNPVFSGGVE